MGLGVGGLFLFVVRLLHPLNPKDQGLGRSVVG